MLMVLGAERPIPCKILPAIIISKLVAKIQIKLAREKTVKPAYIAGFRPKLSDKGPEISCPHPKPKKIMVINN